MGRRAKFSRAQLQTAALAIVDAEGLAGLSMRTLATALGTGPMTIYNHVTDRADLDVLVVEAVLATVRRPRSRADDWRAETRDIATAMWRAVRAHPHVIPLVMTRRSRSPALLDASEAMLAALARSGRSGQSLLVAFRAVTALVMGFAQVELAGPLSISAGETPKAVIGRMRALPKEQYPRLIEIAGAALTSKAEREFRAGLDALLAGLATEA
ncbi:MAG TPA: TetR/AcrR family transcriptional regulator C-terminal domain-containing protein [Candidatus Binatia bacterium]|jgi:AcrR family transcriptional regulator|nr:TetR/AcrR family transcriptional regulator C-terminal domain-containing protein [Candidatus Binatia bacterium]